jgi:hypothetical protein
MAINISSLTGLCKSPARTRIFLDKEAGEYILKSVITLWRAFGQLQIFSFH